MKKKNYELFIINIDQEENLISFLITGMAQKAARGAHNSEVSGSKPDSGIYRHSSEAERGIHNSKVTGSKPVGGTNYLTGMAQR